MKLNSFLFLFLLAICSANSTEAQQQRAWIPQGIDALQQRAVSRTNFSLDHSMLILASKLEGDSGEFRRVIAGVSGISVRRYHFPETRAYDPQLLGSVKEEYRAAGWKQLINRGGRSASASASDLWVRLENNAISNV